MEFSKKLQELRKQKGLTQEELAQKLYVSRTAISKWESGRGYPSIDSLKEIAKFFCVTVDQLLSGEEVLTIAQEDHKQKTGHLRDLVFGLLDLSVIMFFFLPLFGQNAGMFVEEVSLLELTGIQAYLKTGYFICVIATILLGVLTLALQNWEGAIWVKSKGKLSLGLTGLTVLLFIFSRQAYAAAFLFIFFAVKAFLLLKKQ
jgi:transcriptional regulator with XRE-family HTH domain